MSNLTRVVIAVIALMLSKLAFADHNNLAYVTLDEATKQIIEGTYNKVLGAVTERINGKEVYIIKVLSPDGHVQYYKIDAETGQLIS